MGNISLPKDALHRYMVQSYKVCSCSTELSMKFIQLINVKMPTIVGILTFISMVNTTPARFKQEKNIIFQYFIFIFFYSS